MASRFHTWLYACGRVWVCDGLWRLRVANVLLILCGQLMRE